MTNQNAKTTNVMERFRDLPEDLQKAIFSPNTADAILAAGKRAGIPIDKIGELADETGLVMLGVTPPGEFIRNLARRLELDPEKAKAVAEEINQKIFQPVRESLKKVHGLGEAPKASPTTSPLTSPLPLLRKEGTPKKSSSPLQGEGWEGSKGGIERAPRKPLPTRGDITEKIIPPELKTPELPPATSPPERNKISFSPPLLVKERGLGGEVKEELKVKPSPANIESKVKAIFDEIERKKSRKYAPEIPPIFAKNIPAESQGIQAGKPLQDELEADLEKKLSEAPQNNYQKSADPYREPI